MAESLALGGQLRDVVIGSQGNPYTQIDPLLNQIVSTFKANVGVIGIAQADSFLIRAQEEGGQPIDMDSLLSFLGGYFYSVMRVRNDFSPFVVHDLSLNPSIPKELFLNEVTNTASYLISPIVDSRDIKGMLILVSDNPNNFQSIDFNRLRTLTDMIPELLKCN